MDVLLQLLHEQDTSPGALLSMFAHLNLWL